jgi:hypothetical protein
MIENELRRYDNIAAGALEYTGTQEVAHVSGVPVREVIFTKASTPTFFLFLMLMTTATGTNGAWDIAVDGFGPGIDIDLIDINQILNDIGGYGKIAHSSEALFAQFLPDKSYVDFSNALRYFEEHILPKLPAYFIKTPDNKLGLKSWDVFSSGEGMIDLSDDDISEMKISFNYEKVLSKLTEKRVEIRAWNSVDKFEYDVVEYSYSEILALYPEAKKLILEWNGTDGGGSKPSDFNKARIRERYFGLFCNPEVKIEADAFYKHHLIQPGDITNLSSSYLPHMDNGVYGWTDEACLVLSNEINIDEGGASCSLEMVNMESMEKVEFQDIHYWDNAALVALVGTGNAKQIITYNVDADEGLDAEDGFMDQSVYSATNVMIKLEITQPGEAFGTDSEYIEIKIHCQNPTGTNISDQTKRVYYNEIHSEKIYVELYVLGIARTNFDRIKVDWTGAAVQSGTYPPTSVKLIGVKFWDVKAAIDSNTIKSG